MGVGKLPGSLSPSKGLAFADIPNGLGAISKVPTLGWAQIVAYCAFCEVSGMNNRSDAPGDFGWKVLTSADPEEKNKKLAAEIANGRLAMMAIIGMGFQDGLTGSAWGDWATYTDSPLRAFENELGVQAPVGFWDPAGLAADGDAAVFRRRRISEIKHGRISMLATMGYITPELVGKFPGYLSPGNNLKFADVPNGLAALSKVPANGWLQILFYGLYCEAGSGNFGWFDGGSNFDFDGKLVMGAKTAKDTRIPGDCGWRPPLLATDDAETKKRRLNAEIANGRLAMMAIIGMFFQDGLTGSAWGDWALYTASPLRAFESELGVQDPVGFWDPLSFTSDGDVSSFQRRRSVELKHGRVSMLATMGYITPEITGKFPGYLSPPQRGVEARACLDVGDDGLHHAGDHGQVPGLLVPVVGPEVRGHPEWLGGHLQGAGLGLGPDRGLRGLLRALRRLGRLEDRHSGRPRLQGLDIERPGGEDEEVERGDRERPLGHDGDHWHVLPGRAHGLCLG